VLRIQPDCRRCGKSELQQIAEKAEFLAGLEEGLRQIEAGKLIAHEEVKAQFKSWPTGYSGRQ
jgi:predicted transcriptional regulator